MKIVICDDDQAYVDTVSANVQSYFNTHHIHFQISSFTDSLNIYKQDIKYDMAFLDIEMSSISGLDIAQKLKDKNPKIIIFMITAYNQYLDDAMDLQVFRFIQKPLNVPRLFDSLDKAVEILQQSTIPFYLSDRGKTVRIFSDDIIYVEIQNRRTQVVTTKHKYISADSIKYWNDNLPKISFFMVHSSFIINMRFITSYTRDMIVLDNNYTVPIAYRKQASFKQVFSNFCKQ